MHALGYGFQPFDMYNFNPQEILQAPTAPPSLHSSSSTSDAANDSATRAVAAHAAADAAGADDGAVVAPAGSGAAVRSDGESKAAPVVCVLSNILCYCSDDATADFLARYTESIVSIKNLATAFLCVCIALYRSVCCLPCAFHALNGCALPVFVGPN